MIDRRAASPAGGGLSRIPIGAAGGGIGGIVVFLLILFLSGGIGGGGSSSPGDPPVPQGQYPEAELVSYSFV